MALIGGAIADRTDRRRLLLLAQIGLVLCAGGLAAAASVGDPPVVLLYVLGGLLAGFNALQNVDPLGDHPQPGRPAAAARRRWRSTTACTP